MHVLQLVRKRRRWGGGHHYEVTSHDAGEGRESVRREGEGEYKRGRDGGGGEGERLKNIRDYLHACM